MSLASAQDPTAVAAQLELRRELERQYQSCALVRPFRHTRYDAGLKLDYEITGVVPANSGRMTVEVEKFVGGGFAGQVYRVKLLSLDTDGPIPGLDEGQRYAVKVLKPPSGFSRAFRNVLFSLGYQGHFSAQVNPAAVRVGVLWQKLIRRAAARQFGDENAVCDTYATFYDENHRSFGEINEWIDGRIWKFEVDDQLFSRWDFDGRPPADHNSPEYAHKKLFMRDLVALLHEMGAPELARQYEWWSGKSQPNALKRVDADASADKGITAVDFRAGLTLLPFLPMSPIDLWLILRGLARGRLVQFDRSIPDRFDRFIEEHRADYEDLRGAVDELKEKSKIHRSSLPDVTHHHVRLLTSGSLRSSIKQGVITAWRSLGHVDDEHAERLRKGSLLFLLFYLISWVPLLGTALVKFWGDGRAREHLAKCASSLDYLIRAIRGSRISTLVEWHREERVSDDRAQKLVGQPVRYWIQRVLLGFLPAKWHRVVTEPSYGWAKLRDAISFGLKFFRLPTFREDWLLEQVEMGREEGMLSDEEAQKISEQVKDPYIQKYLRCLAVHVCTVPVTQVVMVVAGVGVGAYCMLARELSWAESVTYGTATAAAIQLMPISPGSMARGTFVLYLMIKERDVRNYYIAAPVSFLHVIGYLAFPLQMVAHNPALARFLAGRWAKSLVGIIPVFGESGGLLEHMVFDGFFNLPLSIKRGFKTNPIRWLTATFILSAALAVFAFGGYVRVWEWRQPEVELTSVKVRSIIPYDRQGGGDLHWSLDGMRVVFEGREEPVDYPAKYWNQTVAVADDVDAVIRKSFFGDEYDGLAIAKRNSEARTSTSTPK